MLQGEHTIDGCCVLLLAAIRKGMVIEDLWRAGHMHAYEHTGCSVGLS